MFKLVPERTSAAVQRVHDDVGNAPARNAVLKLRGMVVLHQEAVVQASRHLAVRPGLDFQPAGQLQHRPRLQPGLPPVVALHDELAFPCVAGSEDGGAVVS